jgi:hypothetical protein
MEIERGDAVLLGEMSQEVVARRQTEALDDDLYLIDKIEEDPQKRMSSRG